MLRRSVLLGVGAVVLGAGSALADVRPRVRFPRGASGVTLEGVVVRGDLDIYRVRASAGQQMSVSITSGDENAAFQVWTAGTRYSRGAYFWTFTDGETLEGAGETDDATSFDGELPASGDYLVVVGATRGNASYSLSISIT